MPPDKIQKNFTYLSAVKNC